MRYFLCKDLKLSVLDLTEVFCSDQQGQTIDKEEDDKKEEESLQNGWEGPGNGLSNTPECSDFSFLVIKAVDGTALQTFSCLYVLIVEEGGGDVTMQVSLVTNYGHQEWLSENKSVLLSNIS